MSAATDWQTLKACGPSTAHLFFYDGKPGSDSAAKAVCSRCPVKADCLEHAIANREDHGVWGGMNAPERARVRRRRQRARAATRIQQAQQLLADRGEVTARDAGEALGVPPGHASNALQTLVRRGIAEAVPDPLPLFGGGRRFRYRLVRAGGSTPDG